MDTDTQIILPLEERLNLAQELIQKQIIDQRQQLNFFRNLTRQPAQIDTGYICQHLVSLITGIKGGGFRGKGLDLADGSEVKGANFLDALDKNGFSSARWNFQCNNLESMESFLKYPFIYLASIDLTPDDRYRVRVWKVDPKSHEELIERYNLWMDKLGKPKLNDGKRSGINFQLFPPSIKTNETFARHGNGNKNGFPRVQIELENHPHSSLIFKAESFKDSEGNDIIRIMHPVSS